jgi:hypothetical protein
MVDTRPVPGTLERQGSADIVEKVVVERVNLRFAQSCFNQDGDIGMFVRNILP